MKQNPIDVALKIALEAHAGQFDKAGAPYILHPLRLMHQFKQENAQIAAILHDVVEDSEFTLDDLSEAGFSTVVLEAVAALTRGDQEDYAEFIDRVAQNRLAIEVKIADIRDNLNLERMDELEDRDLKRIKRYHQALKRLTSQLSHQ